MKTLSLVALLLLGGVALAAPEVKPVGLRVTIEDYGKDKYGAELRPYNYDKGTSLVLFITDPAGGLIELNKKKSKITAFRDDKKGNLLKAPDQFGGNPYRINFPKTSRDGKVIMVEVSTKGIPKKGATKLALKGEFVVSSGKEKDLVKSKLTKAQAGSLVKAGKFTFEILKCEEIKSRDHVLEIKLETKRDIDDIAKFRFYNEQGTEIVAKRVGWSSSGSGRKTIYQQTFRLEKSADELVIGLDIWKDKKDIKIPLSLVVPLGLAE